MPKDKLEEDLERLIGELGKETTAKEVAGVSSRWRTQRLVSAVVVAGSLAGLVSYAGSVVYRNYKERQVERTLAREFDVQDVGSFEDVIRDLPESEKEAARTLRRNYYSRIKITKNRVTYCSIRIDEIAFDASLLAPFSELDKLEVRAGAGNDFIAVNGLDKLTKLRTLELGIFYGSQLPILPPSISVLDLRWCSKLESLPDHLTKENYPNLKCVYFSNNLINFNDEKNHRIVKTLETAGVSTNYYAKR